jgi:hypothetical protein
LQTRSAAKARPAAKSSLRSSDLRVGPLLPMPQLLRKAGVRPALVMANCRLKVAVFDDPETRIPFETAALLNLECTNATQRPDFGLLIVQRFDFASMGAIAALMQ